MQNPKMYLKKYLLIRDLMKSSLREDLYVQRKDEGFDFQL